MSEYVGFPTPEGGTFIEDMQLTEGYCSITRYWTNNGATERIGLQFSSRKEYNEFVKDLDRWAKKQAWYDA